MRVRQRDYLGDCIERGIIAPVPLGTPVVWCAAMVLGRKKDGSPRITVDFQHLNSQSLRETHHTEPPFHLASRVPPNTKKVKKEKRIQKKETKK